MTTPKSIQTILSTLLTLIHCKESDFYHVNGDVKILIKKANVRVVE